MTEKKQKNYIATIIAIIAIVVSFSSFLVSYWSYEESKKSNEIAGEALSNSQKSFLLEKRPYLTLKPAKFKEEQQYIVAKEIEDGIEMKVQFEVSNKGQVPAKNINIPGEISLSGDSPNWSPKVSSQTIGKITDIAPKEAFYRVVTISMGGFDEQGAIAENIRRIKDNELTLTMSMIINYESDLDSSIKYKTFTRVIIKANDITILESKID